jgi:hypothetical protein
MIRGCSSSIIASFVVFRLDTFALALVVACGGGGRGQPSATLPVGTPPRTAETSATPVPPVAKTDVAPAAASPRFAALDADLDREYPLSAIIRREGPLYLSREGAAVFTGDRRPVRIPERVLDADLGRNPRRPRLLCEEMNHRVAVYMDASDLTTVALTGAVLRPDRGAQGPSDANAPGVYFAAGAELQPVTGGGLPASDGATTPVHYERLFLDADGFVATDHIDVVFSNVGSAIPAVTPDGELTSNVAMSSQPGGPAFARIAKEPRVVNQLLIRRLGKPVNGFVLVRYDEDEAFAIGWVPAKAVRAYDAGDAGEVNGVMRGVGGGLGGTNHDHVTLARGTLLSDQITQQIVGVVENEEIVECDRACAGSKPIVSLDACDGTIEVRALLSP